MTILITGGCGFIGSHLVESFTARGQHVTVLDDLSSGNRANLTHPALVTLVEGDVADAALVQKLVANASEIYHLAAIASVAVCANEPARAARTNVGGTQALFDAVAATGRAIPVVYASSAAVYGDNQNLPLAESAVPAPISAYGEHKLANERTAAKAFSAHGISSVGLRLFNVYGPRQDASSPYSGVISKFMDGARAGQPLTVFGDGGQTRDFVFVGDVVQSLRASAALAHTTAHAHRVNVCTGRATSLIELIKVIGQVFDKNIEFTNAPARDADIRHSLGDATTMLNMLGISVSTPLEKGLPGLRAL